MSYPIFVNIAGQQCVVVGGGSVALRRVEGLIAGEAVIRVVAPTTEPGIEALAAAQSLNWLRSRYGPEHIEGAFLVIAATDDPAVNASVCSDARRRGVLSCCVDDPAAGTFTVPALIVRGDLSIAITTGGASPTLTSVLREELAERFGPEWVQWAALFARMRPEIRRIAGGDRRRSAVRALLADDQVAARIRAANIDGAVLEAMHCISLLPD